MDITLDSSDVAHGLSMSVINECVRESLASVGDKWRSDYQPGHFGAGAAAKYGYKPRRGEPGSGRPFRGSYAARKSRKGKRNNPLEFTGQSRRETESTRRIKATATKGAGTVRITFAKTYNYRHPKSPIKMGEELATVLSDELAALTSYYVQTLNMKLQERIDAA